MSTVPEPAPTVGAAPVSKFKSCLSCRVLSGGGLIAAGLYVYTAAKRTMRLGGPPTIGLAAQLTFAASLGALGIVVIADPVGKLLESSTD